jgi:hypothetical protein
LFANHSRGHQLITNEYKIILLNNALYNINYNKH